jgi:deoxyribodipyrimidine photo-lyase
MPNSPTLLWLRQDLRLDDNPALRAALDRGQPIIPFYLWAPDEEGDWAAASASRWWLHSSLTALEASLRKVGSRLIIRQGATRTVLTELIEETRASAVVWNRRYEPMVARRDEVIRKRLEASGVEVDVHNSALLFEHEELRTKPGRPFQVFTPFWKACLNRPIPPVPRTAPRKLPAPHRWPRSAALEELGLLPAIDWAAGIRGAWTPGEKGALKRLKQFLDHGALDYDENRDRPDLEGTSSLSPHLHFGEISPRRVWHATEQRFRLDGPKLPRGAEVFLKELGWREFAYHLLHHFPQTTDEPLRQEFAWFPWKPDSQTQRAWQRGQTGYPLVDAGMRQLWRIGWMHNRVRMVVASFLVKHLLTSWQEGAKWFWDTLVDADLASNTLGWQWSAGCGADAAPYFRIFNPMVQGERFDPEGRYVARWVPELARLPAQWIHRPWQAPDGVLREANVELGRTYPQPIIEHNKARQRALGALKKMQKS